MWELLLDNFRVGPFVWELSLWNFRLGSFALGGWCLGTLVWELKLGNFRLVGTLAWELSLGNFRLEIIINNVKNMRGAVEGWWEIFYEIL